MESVDPVNSFLYHKTETAAPSGRCEPAHLSGNPHHPQRLDRLDDFRLVLGLGVLHLVGLSDGARFHEVEDGEVDERVAANARTKKINQEQTARTLRSTPSHVVAWNMHANRVSTGARNA